MRSRTEEEMLFAAALSCRIADSLLFARLAERVRWRRLEWRRRSAEDGESPERKSKGGKGP